MKSTVFSGWRLAIAVAIVGLWAAGWVRAAEPPLTLEAYWHKIEETQQVLAAVEETPAEQQRAQLLALADQWAAISEVIMPDGVRAPVDHSYLAARLRAPAPDVDQLRNLLAGLLAASRSETGATFGPEAQAALGPILARSEFQWPPETPSPLEEWRRRLTQRFWEFMARLLFDNGVIDLQATWIRYLFTALGVIIVILVVAFILRSVVGDLIVEATVQGEASPSAEFLTADSALRQAQKLSNSGDYRTAVRYLYLSSLLALEERGLLRYDRFRTNREYLGSVGHLPEVATPLRQVIEVFDRVWYGYASLDQAAYAQYAAWVADLRRQK